MAQMAAAAAKEEMATVAAKTAVAQTEVESRVAAEAAVTMRWRDLQALLSPPLLAPTHQGGAIGKLAMRQ